MENSKSVRTFSLLGQRGTFGVTLEETAKHDDRVVGITADLAKTSGMDRFITNYPDRFYNVGIAEQNAIGFAAGLADAGKVPFVTTFANFATLRANEFVRHFMAYMQCNIKLVGLGSGFSMELFGTTHYGVEDVSAIRSMPNIVILSPCDGLEVKKCVEYCIDHKGPVYLRLSGKGNNPIVNKNDYDFEPGKGIVLREGTDGIIYATGSMVFYSLKAAEILSNSGLEICVVNIHTIKPIDKEIILKNKDYPVISTIEEHSIEGGLGSAVAETLSEKNNHGKLLRFGVVGEYKKAGTYEYMLEQHGLTPQLIAKKIEKQIKNSFLEEEYE